MITGYPRFPTICGDTIVFVAEDDLWQVSANGGVAIRITAGVSAASDPAVSPDGRLVAYAGAEEGPKEVYVVPIEGGESKRLTYEGGFWCQVAGWTPSGDEVIFSSNVSSPNRADMRLHRVHSQGGVVEPLDHGRAASITYGPDGVVVIGREYWKDSAHWKRYRGGTAGQLWIDRDGSGEFSRLITLDGNLSKPNIVDDRVYFLSDHEGYGNVYSVTFAGDDLRRHTDHDDFYARGLSSDGTRLVYHSGGSIYVVTPGVEHPRKLDITIGATRTQRARRFVDASQYLHSADPCFDGSQLAITTRGKAYTFGNWEGPVNQLGETDGVRYQHLRWLKDSDRLVAVIGDRSASESVVVMSADGTAVTKFDELDIGRVIELTVSHKQDLVAVANHRNELLLIDVNEGTSRCLDRSTHGTITGPVFSPDGDWLAYACPDAMSQEDSASLTAIKLLNIVTGEKGIAADRVLRDDSPSFDPDGNYLYFIGHREFDPSYDRLSFDLGFPKGSRPYVVALRPDVPAPFVPRPKSLHDTGETSTSVDTSDSTAEPAASGNIDSESTSDSSTTADGETNSSTDDADTATVEEPPSIVLEGIRRRVVPLPVADGVYTQVLGVSQKALVLSEPIDANDIDGVIDMVDLTSGKIERHIDSANQMILSGDAKTLLYVTGDQLRVVKAAEKPADTVEYSRESGWIDLTRVKVSVRPELEWPQMFRESWRLMRDHFWDANLVGIDWDGVYGRYAPLVERVSTRGELSDLIWEMNGELGTSHAYESAGDYRPGPHYGQGYLGARFIRRDDGMYLLNQIYTGDIWNPDMTSPFYRPGVDAQVGDVILAINGQRVGGDMTPAQRLVNLADQEIAVRLQRDDHEPHTVVVKALASESDLRYRDWVEDNRATVHEKTNGLVGYVHVPDMGPAGFAEFHRGYLNEYDRDGLIIDVRYNGGGHVSGLLIEKLARRRIGYDFSRWNSPIAHPMESPMGPMVALTNELAGSDGDIFSQSFKQMGLGPLIGTRTWGGVVGYTARPGLSDNTFLSQPEFAFHFSDTKWGVENYGVEPDIEVEFPPQDYAAGVDPQLDKAIEVALAQIALRPGLPRDQAERPRLAPPPLPPRS